MTGKKMTFQVTDTGIQVEAHGFQGQGCQETTEKFLCAAGLQPEEVAPKDEFFQQEEVQADQEFES